MNILLYLKIIKCNKYIGKRIKKIKFKIYNVNLLGLQYQTHMNTDNPTV